MELGGQVSHTFQLNLLQTQQKATPGSQTSPRESPLTI